LIADYTNTVGSYKDRIIKNPVAFLAKGYSLILGVVEIETKVVARILSGGAYQF